MKASLSAHSLSGSLMVSFGSSTGSTSPALTPEGSDLWFDENGRLTNARIDLGITSDVEMVLGPDAPLIVRSMISELDSSDEVTRDIEVPDRVNRSHRRLYEQYAVASKNLVSAPEQSMSPTARYESLVGDGNVTIVELETAQDSIRAGEVRLPAVAGHEYLMRRSAEVMWNLESGELLVRVHLSTTGDDARVWVRVAVSESGDVLALARPREGDGVGHVAATVVPPDIHMGEIYVDVTVDPLSPLGSSRHRARRRAAELEEFASTTSDTEVARAARDRANRMRSALGEPPDLDMSIVIRRKRKWLGPLLLVVGMGVGWLLGQNRSDSGVSQVDTVPSMPLVSGSSTTAPEKITETGDEVLPSGLPVVSGVEVLAYQEGSVGFFGVGDVSIAAMVSEVDSIPVLEIQRYSNYEYPYRDGTFAATQSTLDMCLAERGSNTGADSGFTREFPVTVYGFDDRESAIAGLVGDPTGTEIGRYDGSVRMTGNVVENCEIRDSGGTPSVLSLSRQVFETVQITLSGQSKYAVVRLDGAGADWKSDQVIELRP